MIYCFKKGNLICMKSCSNKDCKQINPQPLTEFNKNVKAKDGLYSLCRPCVSLQNMKYYEKNREERLKYHKEYSQTPEGKASGKIGRKKYSKTDKGKIAQNKYLKSPGGKEVRAQIDKKHRQTPKGKATHSAIQAQRRASKLQATPGWTTNEEKLTIKTIYIEAARLTEETGIKHYVDHRLPLQGEHISGLHLLCNLQILTDSENSSKNDKFDFTYDNEGWRQSNLNPIGVSKCQHSFTASHQPKVSISREKSWTLKV